MQERNQKTKFMYMCDEDYIKRHRSYPLGILINLTLIFTHIINAVIIVIVIIISALFVEFLLQPGVVLML